MSAPRAPGLDVPTVVAIGLVAYVLRNVAHEALGHGGATLLVGGTPLGLSSAWWDGNFDAVSEWGRRWERAAGTFVNLGLGLALVPASRAALGVHSRFFLWLLAVVNLFSGAGYLLTDPLGNFGDWSGFLEGLEPKGLLRAGLVASGAAFSMLALRFARQGLEPFLGGDPTARRRRARWLCLAPYVAGSLAFTLAGLLNPLGPKFAVSSALASFGGTAFLAWLPSFVKGAPEGAPPAPELGRSVPWLAAGALAAVILFGVLAPGIRFQR